MTHSSELILLPSLKAQRGPRGGLVLTQKFLNGVAQYAKTWPGGRVTTLVNLRDTPTSDMDHVEVMPGETTTPLEDRKSTRLNSSHVEISYAVFCLKKKKKQK